MKRPMPSIRQHARPRGRAEQERGQIIVLFTLVIVAILAFTALVVDVGLLRNNRQSLANAVDAGALAGGTLMPVDGSQSGAAAAVVALINQTIRATYPGLSTSNYNITYRCLVGTGAGNAGAFDKADIDAFVPVDCDPRNALGHNPPFSAISPAPARRAARPVVRIWATSATSSWSRATSRPPIRSRASWA